jgi:hypothetical protein
MKVNKMKYAQIERERRFLLQDLPAGLAQRPFTHITDHYLPHTRLRLRRMTDETGAIVALKLTQKFRETGFDKLSDQPGSQTIITNFYLNGTEYQTLAQLGGNSLTKRRYRLPSGSHKFSIDVFEGDLAGLVLAEIEALTDEELAHVPQPEWAVAEVTGDVFFTGGNLVTTTPAQLRAKLATYQVSEDHQHKPPM